ncbi:MAG: hypothetical protein MK098_12695 [Marinovum sp.]|nr:hypothetical protein [Marinovum sp.]
MPLALRDTSAAKELDMPVSEFLRLVQSGALPPPVYIGNNERWRYQDIAAILTGKAAMPSDDIE